MSSAPDPIVGASSAAACPLCGESNACGQLSGAAECWCMATKIPEAALEQIPADAKGVACICRACATKAAARSGE
jgi:hypothetical protein